MRAYDHLNDLDTLFVNFPREIAAYKNHLRLVYQVLVSPQYGKCFRAVAAELFSAYDSYAKVLADRLCCEYDDLSPYIHLFISIATNYILWEDETKAIRQYEELYRSINLLIIGNQHKRDDYGTE